jgi:hypothetical protein
MPDDNTVGGDRLPDKNEEQDHLSKVVRFAPLLDLFIRIFELVLKILRIITKFGRNCIMEPPHCHGRFLKSSAARFRLFRLRLGQNLDRGLDRNVALYIIDLLGHADMTFDDFARGYIAQTGVLRIRILTI